MLECAFVYASLIATEEDSVVVLALRADASEVGELAEQELEEDVEELGDVARLGVVLVEELKVDPLVHEVVVPHEDVVLNDDILKEGAHHPLPHEFKYTRAHEEESLKERLDDRSDLFACFIILTDELVEGAQGKQEPIRQPLHISFVEDTCRVSLITRRLAIVVQVNEHNMLKRDGYVVDNSEELCLDLNVL